MKTITLDFEVYEAELLKTYITGIEMGIYKSAQYVSNSELHPIDERFDWERRQLDRALEVKLGQ